MTGPIRVVLVDDHAVMRTGFRMILESAGDIEVVGEASDGAAAVDLVTRVQPNVVFMDVQMPVLDGLEATRRIVSDPSIDAAVVIVTTFDRDDYLFQSLEAGASGFLLKNAAPEELITAARVAAAGDALLAPEVTRRVIGRFTGERSTHAVEKSHVVTADPVTAVDLTEREGEVLRLLAQALSNAEIAQRLFIGEATVKTHVSNVLLKLGTRDRVGAVVYAHRHGLT